MPVERPLRLVHFATVVGLVLVVTATSAGVAQTGDCTNGPSLGLGGTTATGDVVATDVRLPDGGFVAVHTIDYAASVNEDINTTETVDPGSVLSASRYIEQGCHAEVSVPIDSNISLPERVALIAYQDTDDDRTYDFVASNGSVDTPYQTPYVVGTDGVVEVDGPALAAGKLNDGGILGVSGAPDWGQAGDAAGDSEGHADNYAVVGVVIALIVLAIRWTN